MSRWSKIKGYLPAAAIATAFLWSGLSILFYRAKGPPAGAIVIRFGHWQLESSVRDAVNELAQEYLKQYQAHLTLALRAQAQSRATQRVEHRLQGVVVLHRVVFGQFQQDPVQR